MTIDRAIAEDLAALRTMDDRELLALEHVRALAPRPDARPTPRRHAGLVGGGLAALACAASVVAFSGIRTAIWQGPWGDDVTRFHVGTLLAIAMVVAAVGYGLGRRVKTCFDTASLALAIAGPSAVAIVLGKLLLTDRVGTQWEIQLFEITRQTLLDSAIAIVATTACSWPLARAIGRGWPRSPAAVVAAGIALMIATFAVGMEYDVDDVAFGGANLAGETQSHLLRLALTAAGSVAVVLVTSAIVALVYRRSRARSRG